jgi:methyltransferase FkbM-like protein
VKLVYLGTQYGGWTIDIDRIPTANPVIIDAGVGTDMSFSEAMHEIRPGLHSVLVDHTDESENFVNKVRGYSWTTFIKAAVAPLGSGPRLTMFRHKTSGSESFSAGHNFVNRNNAYVVPTVHLSDLIIKYRPCLVKLDIESAEYGTIRECIGVDQVCCEFHHRMDTAYTEKDTDAVLTDFIAAGYVVAHRTQTDEILMVRK